MANQPNPNDPYRPNLTDEEISRQVRLDSELQADPALAEGPVGGSKVTMYAIAIAAVLGVIFYGLNNTSINPAGTSSTAQNTTETSSPAVPPGMRDVTPRANTDQGTTTGVAPTRMNRYGNPAGK